MDPASILGVVIAFAAIFTMNHLEGGAWNAMFKLAPMILVFGGTFGVAMAGGVIKDFMSLPKAIMRAITIKIAPPDESVAALVGLAEQARRNGLLALEESARSVEDPFLRRGVELLVDGTDPEELRDILDAQVDAKRTHDKLAIKMFADMGAYAPTIGIIGTVLSLIVTLGNLDDVDRLGYMIGAAFVATLWGVASANVLWLPLSAKLKRISDLEIRQMNLLIEGLMSIQAGSNPRMIELKLRAYLPADSAPAKQQEAA